jgi:hypothetical protein
VIRMQANLNQSGNFQTVTYQLEEGVYEAVITNIKRKISVTGCGATALEAYSNALQRMEEEGHEQ